MAALNTGAFLKLFCDVNSKKLVESPFDSSIYNLPPFFNGDIAPIELQLLLPNSRGGLSYQYLPLEEAVSVELGLVTVADTPTELAASTLTQKYKLWSVDIIDGGSDWSVGDSATVTATLATGDIAATVLVTSVAGGVATSVEILQEGLITTPGTHPATGWTTSKLIYNSASAADLKLRIIWAGSHTGTLSMDTTGFDTWLGSDNTKETTFEIRVFSGTAWEQTVFQTTATVKQEGFQ